MFRGQKRDDTTLEQLVLQAQAGDEQIRHRLIEDYQPFIATSVSRVCKRYIDQEQDDEFSIGLIAFNEAIDSFHEGKGSSFFTFARLVISRKVIDYIRQQKHHRQTVPLEYSGQSNEAYTEEKSVSELSTNQFIESEHAWNRQIEIEEYNEKLQEYKLSFAELVKFSPKHEDTKKQAQKIAKLIYGQPEIRQYVMEKKRLPIKKILPLVDVSKKTIERNRKYILAVFVLLNEDFMYLKEYVKEV
ncbi:RNA polymerase sigma-I factor [Allobacillus halotolerans]|uniref:RNA polymerase sigma factor SigI n=1 Tax=Allobacillus halotolerans TaxID=570278 RepID=A0ABS6GNN8_9BACI|nr:RNA polymerase sigma-I factor [Allobacillus halotolerans]MBU6080730.1 RNA polymerase sigma-I factor [Allobacillus halotolerans]